MAGRTWRGALLAALLASLAGCLGDAPTGPGQSMDSDASWPDAASDGDAGAGATHLDATPGPDATSSPDASYGTDAATHIDAAAGADASHGPDASTGTDASRSDATVGPAAPDAGDASVKESGAADVSGPPAPDAHQDAPPSGPTQLMFLAQPANGAPNVPENSVQVAVVDTTNRVVATATNTITLSLGANPSGAAFLGVATATAVAGTATFPTVGVDRAGTGFTLVASSPSLASATSVPFNVVAPFTRVPNLVGGDVLYLAFAGTTQPSLYARVDSGAVYKSTDHAATWALADFGDPNTAGHFAADPADANVIYTAGAAGQPIGKTSNGGGVWAALGLSTGRCFAMDPTNPSILYSGASRSTDGGVTWNPTGFPAQCVDLAVDPVTPTTLYALASNATTGAAMGVYKSADSGATWSPTNDGSILEAGLGAGGRFIFALPTGVFVIDSQGALYRSPDGGASWQSILGYASSSVVASPTNPMRVYAASDLAGNVYISDDGGATFPTVVDLHSGLVNAITIDPTNSNLVYAGAAQGVFASTDGGMTWAPSSTGIPCMTISAVAVTPGSPSIVYVGAPTTILRSADSGLTWSAGPTLASSDFVGAIAIDPAVTSHVVACGGLTGQVYFSHDGGLTWTTGGGAGGGCRGLAIQGSTLWAGTASGVTRSTDGGLTWSAPLLAGVAYSIAVDPTGSSLYSGTLAGTYRSTNGGATWTSMVANDFAVTMLIDPLTPTTVYEATGCALMTSGMSSNPTAIRRSLDSGGSWTTVLSTNSCPGGGIISLPSGTLFAIVNAFGNPVGSGGVMRSTNGGTAWTPLGIGVAAAVGASSDGTIVYAGTNAGLYVSVSGGM